MSKRIFLLFTVTLSRFAMVAWAWTVVFLDAEIANKQICERAIGDATAAGLCPQSITLVQANGCGDNYKSSGTAEAARRVLVESASAVVTDNCGAENRDIGRLAYFWNVPVLLRSGNALATFGTTTYPTSVLFDDTSAVGMATTITYLATAMAENAVVLVGPAPPNPKRTTLVRGMKEYMDANPSVRVQTLVELDEDNWGASSDALTGIRTATKMIVIDGEFNDLKQALNNINVVGLAKDLYEIVLLCQTSVEICTAQLGTLVFDASMIVIAPVYRNLTQVNSLLSTAIGQNIPPQKLSDYYGTYTTCFGLCLGVRSGTTGSGFVNAFRGQQISQFPLDELAFDSSGARIPHYTLVWQADKSQAAQQAFVANGIKADPCLLGRCFDLQFAPVTQGVWSDRRGVPINTCAYVGGCVNFLPYIFGGAAAVVVVGIVVFIFFHRRQKRLDSYRMHWRIPRAQLKVIENKNSSVKGKVQEGVTFTSKRRTYSSYALLGTIKAEFIELRNETHIRWSKEDLRFLMELKKVSHDNITNFIGICFNDGEKFYILHNLVERASLDDFVHDHDFRFDNTFRSAFLRDILKGLAYLHKSAIGYHGLLNLSNCLIDGNWVLKLTDFGVTNFLHRFTAENQLKIIQPIPAELFYYVAPEYLKGINITHQYPRGCAVGDSYSFGIVLHQIMFRQRLYEKPLYSLSEVFQRIMKGHRPQIEEYAPEDKPLIDLMVKCWSEKAEERPNVRTLSHLISSAFQSTQGNLVDQMIRMNEKHAANLEQIVADRNAMLVEAQEQTDRLLCEILPPSIADKLKSGEPIPPRSYEAATVLFCQLVDFVVVLNSNKPDQVISFLNAVFTLFDRIISRHDAYKVETTGETYMVASGVPNENENRHVFEISEIALEMRHESLGYKVPGMPHVNIQVRIGYHCGPIAAGVIGLKAPRFCLFGDTVNFASRMQSNCPPNQIQMSEGTALLLMEKNEYQLTKRGIVHVKGKGDVNTYWLNEHIHHDEAPPAVITPVPPTAPRRKSKTGVSTAPKNEPIT